MVNRELLFKKDILFLDQQLYKKKSNLEAHFADIIHIADILI